MSEMDQSKILRCMKHMIHKEHTDIRMGLKHVKEDRMSIGKKSYP